MSDNFESVKKSGPTWECKQTGKKSDNSLVALTPSKEKSWIIGYYLGSEVISTNNGESTVHKLKMVKVGDKSHIIGEEEDSNEVSIWGTGVLNDNLKKIAPGQYIKIVWEGKAQPKKGSNPYHTWDVLLDKSVEPLALGSSNVGNTTASPTQAVESSSPQSAPAVAVEEDDDLPFSQG